MFLRRLTESGLEQFRGYLDQLKNDPKLPPPTWMLTSDETSEKIGPILEVEQREFATRLEVAQYLDELIHDSGLERVDRDIGLWSWLALFYFDQICPAKKNGHRKPAVPLSYIPEFTSGRYYRHLLLGPWFALQPHRDDPRRLLAILCHTPSVATGETYRSFIENSELLVCQPVIETVTRLYYDVDSRKLKRGSGKRNVNGDCRRLITYLQQIDCTFDLHSISPDQLFEMLPKEFEKFKAQT